MPSVAESALFGTRLADDWFDVRHGRRPRVPDRRLPGALASEGWIDREFIARTTRRASRRPRAAVRGAGLGATRARAAAPPRARDAALRRDCCATRRTPSSSGPWASRSTRTASHTIAGARQRRPGARLARPRRTRPDADPRPLRRAGRRGGRLRARRSTPRQRARFERRLGLRAARRRRA